MWVKDYVMCVSVCVWVGVNLRVHVCVAQVTGRSCESKILLSFIRQEGALGSYKFILLPTHVQA